VVRALGVLLSAALAGCTSVARPAKPKLLEQPARALAPPTNPRRAWPPWSRVQGWPTVTRAGTLSRGHLPERRLVLDVRVDPNSREAYSQWVRDSHVEPGAIVVALLRDPKTRAVAVAYAMEKRRDGVWEFLVLSLDGSIQPGDSRCAACHADAVADFIFGPPSP
jgi:hypothetical protein